MSQTAEERAMHAMAQDRVNELIKAHLVRWPDRRAKQAPTREEIPQITRPTKPSKPAVGGFERRLVDEIPWYRLGERRIARDVAARQAEDAHQHALQRHQHALRRHEVEVAEREKAVSLQRLEQEAEARLLARAFDRLAAGDRPSTERAISDVLTRLSTPARLAGWLGDAPVLRIDAPGVEVVPERKPARTPGGKPTTKPRGKGESNDVLAQIVAAATIAAARAAFSAAPAVSSVIAVSVSRDGVAVAEGRFDRDSFGSTRDPVEALLAAGGLISQSGRTRTLDSIELDEAELADMLGL